MSLALARFILPSCLLALLPLLNSCGNRRTGVPASPSDTLSLQSKAKAPFQALEPGIFDVSDKDFGDLIELKGTPVPITAIFKPTELEMIVKGDLMIMKSRQNDKIIKFLSLPDFRIIKEMGTMGGGPGELQSPMLVETADPGLLCYLYDLQQEKLYQIDTGFTMTETTFHLEKKEHQMFGSKQFVETGHHEFYYASNAPGGKAIYHYLPDHKDSVQLVFNLEDGFKKNLGWSALIGDFGGNLEKQRLVYAYKYFHQIRFFDVQTGNSRTLRFKALPNQDTESLDPRAVLAPTSVTHYWGMCPQPEQVYCIYSGRTPIQVQEEFRKETDHIFIEQFDWNGHPVKKYKLDHWGYFCVDEAHRTIYVAAVNAVDPMYSYTY